MAVIPPSATSAAGPVRGPGLRRTDVVLLTTAPLVLALGRLLLVPFDDQEWDRMLSDMAANPTRSAIGWGLALVAAALLTVAGVALVRLVPDRPRLTVPALVGVALGWTGTAAVAAIGLVMGEMASSPERNAMVRVLTDMNEGTGNIVFILVLAGVLGNVLLAIALTRGGIATRGTGVLLAVGAVASLVGAPGPFKPIAVSGAVLLMGAYLLLLRAGLSPTERENANSTATTTVERTR